MDSFNKDKDIIKSFKQEQEKALAEFKSKQNKELISKINKILNSCCEFDKMSALDLLQKRFVFRQFIKIENNKIIELKEENQYFEQFLNVVKYAIDASSKRRILLKIKQPYLSKEFLLETEFDSLYDLFLKRIHLEKDQFCMFQTVFHFYENIGEDIRELFPDLLFYDFYEAFKLEAKNS